VSREHNCGSKAWPADLVRSGLKLAYGMTVDLKPEDEQLIQKRLEHGGFSSAQEVIHRALQAQDAEEAWLDLHKRKIAERIDQAITEFDQGAVSREVRCGGTWRK
jgi:putative addiction module CopG family antidote